MDADKCASVAGFVAVPANANQQVIGGSYHRRGVIFTCPGVAGTFYLSNNPMTAAGQGLALVNPSGYIYLCKYLHGDCVNKPWYCWSTVATGIGVIEVMEP